MSLSNKKRKYIQRLAGKKRSEAIAKDLGIPVAQVEAEIKKLSGAKTVTVRKKESYLTSFNILAVLVFLAPFPMFKEIYSSSYLAKAALIQIGSLLLLTVWLFEQFRTKSFTIVKCRFYWPLAAFLLWALVSISWAMNTYAVLAKWTHWMACGLIFFLAMQIVKENRQVRFLFKMMVASAVVLSFLGYFQYLQGVEWFPQTAPPAATFANKNMAGHFFVLVFPASLYLLLSAKNKKAIWTFAFCLACVNLFIYYTFTKAAWVSVAWECLLFMAIFGFERLRFETKIILGKQKTAALAAAIALTFVMSNLTPDGWKWRLGENYYYLSGLLYSPEEVKDEEQVSNIKTSRKYSALSVYLRLILYKNTLELIAEKPLLGVGTDNFSVHYPKTSIKRPRDTESLILTQAYHGHNDYLQLLSELGLPFGLLFLWGCWLLVKEAGSLLMKERPPEDRLIGAAALIALGGLALNANISFPLYRAVPPLLLAVYSAIFFKSAQGWTAQKGSQRDNWIIAGKKWSGTTCILSTVALISWTYAQYRVIKADEHYHSMHVAIKLEQFEEALTQVEIAKHYNPLRKDTLKMKGQIYLKLGEVEKARDLLAAYREINPNYAQGLMLLGRSHQLLKEYNEAEKVLEKGIEIDPNVERMHDLLASVKSSLGKHEEALREFRMAADLKPENVSYQYNLGIKARSMGLLEEAAQAFRKTVELNDSNDKAHLLLGLILFYELNEPDSGIKHLKKALTLNPAVKDAEQLRQMIATYESGLQK